MGKRTGTYYIHPQERKPQAQRDWLDLLQGRAHNVHKMDVCALSLLRWQLRAPDGGRTRAVLRELPHELLR